MSNALVTDLKTVSNELEGYLVERRGIIEQVCHGVLNSERLIHLAMSVGRRTPALLKCEPASWVTALLDASFFGIEPNPQLGHAYLIPYKNNKRKTLECQFMIGYKGKRLLAIQSGLVQDVQATVVYDCDEFKLDPGRKWEGKSPYVYTPVIERPDDAALRLVFCEAVMPDGPMKFCWLPKSGPQSIAYYRGKSRAANSGPWVDSYEAMAKKTVVHRMCDELPMKPDSKIALSHKYEAAFEEGAPMHAYRFDDKRGVVEAELAEEAE